MSVQLERFKQDFDALANFLPKKSTAPKKGEGAEKATEAEASFRQKFSAFQSQYAGQVDELKRQLSAKRLSSDEHSSDLEITAAKISSLEQIAKLGADKADAIEKALLLPYQKNVNSMLKAETGLLSEMGCISVDVIPEIITTPDEVGITTPLLSDILKDERGYPIIAPSEKIKAFAITGGWIVIPDLSRGITYLYNNGGGVVKLNKENGEPIQCKEITVAVDGQTFIAKEDKTDILRLYKANGELIVLRSESSRPIYCEKITVAADGQTIVAKEDKTGIVRLYKANGEPIPLLFDGERVWCSKIEVSADGKTIVVIEKKTGRVYLYGVEGKVSTFVQKRRIDVFGCDITVSADGQTIIATEDKTDIVRLYNANGELIPLLDETGNPIHCKRIIVSADGQTIVAKEDKTGVALLYNAEKKLIASLGLFFILDISADGQTFLGTGEDAPSWVNGFINCLYSTKTGKHIPFLNEKGEPIYCRQVRVSTDGRTLTALEYTSLTYGHSGEHTKMIARLFYNNATKDFIPLLDETGKPVNYKHITVSADGQIIIATEHDETRIVRPYNTNGELIPLRNKNNKPIDCNDITVSASANGPIIIATEKGTSIVRPYEANGELIPLQDETGKLIDCHIIRVSANGEIIIVTKKQTNIVSFYTAKGELLPDPLNEKGESILSGTKSVPVYFVGELVVVNERTNKKLYAVRSAQKLFRKMMAKLPAVERAAPPLPALQSDVVPEVKGSAANPPLVVPKPHSKGLRVRFALKDHIIEKTAALDSVQTEAASVGSAEVNSPSMASRPYVEPASPPVAAAGLTVVSEKTVHIEAAPPSDPAEAASIPKDALIHRRERRQDRRERGQALYKRDVNQKKRMLKRKKVLAMFPLPSRARSEEVKPPSPALQSDAVPVSATAAVAVRIEAPVNAIKAAPATPKEVNPPLPASNPDAVPVSATAAAAVRIEAPVNAIKAAPATPKEVNPPLPASNPDAAPVSATAAAAVRIEAPVNAIKAAPATPKEAEPPLPASNPDAVPVSRFARFAAALKVLGKILIGLGVLINVPRLIRILTSWIKKR